MTGYYWVPWYTGTQAPSNAVQGGFDVDGSPIYVGRADFDGDRIPAKVMPDKSAIYVAYGGNEVSLNSCELLCQQTFKWISCSNGMVPAGALPAGHTSDGETLYAGRVYHEGSHTIGKIHPSHGCCYIPFGGEEIKHCEYEVLVLTDD